MLRGDGDDDHVRVVEHLAGSFETRSRAAG
jgi:hypothetical protein